MVRWLVLAGGIVIADFASKAWVLAAFHLHEGVAVTSFFNLVLVMNPGASFSFLADAGGWQKWVFVGLALAISVWLFTLIRHHAAEKLMPTALALVLGGRSAMSSTGCASVRSSTSSIFTSPAGTGRPSTSPIRPSPSASSCCLGSNCFTRMPDDRPRQA